MYTQMTVIVDGALDYEQDYYDYVMLDDAIRNVREDALDDGYHTEIYLIHHDHHPDGEECTCVQHLQDHNPAYVFND